MSAPRILTREEKEAMKKKMIHTGTATGQGTGSYMQELLTRESGPLRFAERPPFDKTNISDLLQYEQYLSGRKIYDDGAIISFVKETIFFKIENNELRSEEDIQDEINKMFTEIQKNFVEGVKNENPKQVVSRLGEEYGREAARHKAANEPARELERARLAEIERLKQIEIETKKQMILTINNFKTAIADIQKMNKTLFTPTGIKAMQAEIKKFDAIPDPSNRDREKLIAKIKEIADARLQEKKSSRGKILEEFYRKVSKAEVGKTNTLSKDHMGKSQIAIQALVTIQVLTTKNNGPDSTFGKIQEIVGKNIPATDKMTAIKGILESRLENGENLKADYKQTYKALIKFITQVEKGKTPNLDDPKLMFLNKKLADIKNDQIIQGLKAAHLLPNEKSPKKPTQKNEGVTHNKMK